jgi:ferritin
LLRHELAMSASINELVDQALKKGYATNNFLQWYIMEQMEEEKLARDCNDKLEMIGDDKSDLYLFGRDIMSMVSKA